MKVGYEQMIDRLKNKARKGTCKHRVAAVGLDFRNRPILIAFNKHRFTRIGGSLHAEMEVMRRAPKSLRTIIICRVNRSGQTLPIKPCKACAAKAKELGIKIVSLPPCENYSVRG